MTTALFVLALVLLFCLAFTAIVVCSEPPSDGLVVFSFFTSAAVALAFSILSIVNFAT